MIYQDPLAYLLGLEGIALLDAWAGDHDRAFTEARLAEIRRLLDDEKLRGHGVLAERVSSVVAYQQQSAGYDAEAGGGLFAADEPVVAECLDGREPGVALDAACGTGRFAEFLARHWSSGTSSDPPPEPVRPESISTRWSARDAVSCRRAGSWGRRVRSRCDRRWRRSPGPRGTGP